ncbi:HSF-DOMAIN domain-containing protein [Aphelenchoides besseyi]|nr:HSF-DOMAIN domain-containing protein [Aphelenchoides besseyi]KAI6207679.1 HSF-DOMAIN domain-containing protein [Aphelenchoides besseyi]
MNRRASSAKPRETTGLSSEKLPQLPNFLLKLWSILNDPNFETIICWNEDGSAFHIVDSITFCRSVLPQYFKHNNLNSFVRQLNLYGFRKVILNKPLEGSDNLNFSHPHFLRGRQDLLHAIKRNYPTTKRTESIPIEQQPPPPAYTLPRKTVSIPEEDLVCLLRELKIVRERQNSMRHTITQLTRDNILLWQEMAQLRNSNTKQQENVGKLVTFLMGIVQPSQKRMPNNSQRIVPLEEELEDAMDRGASTMNYGENSNVANELAIRRAQNGNKSTVIDCGILDRIQQELNEPVTPTAPISLNAESALLEGLQLRQRAIEEGANQVDNCLLGTTEDRSQAIERSMNIRNEINFRYYDQHLKRPFQHHVLSPVSPSNSLCSKRPFYSKERLTVGGNRAAPSSAQSNSSAQMLTSAFQQFDEDDDSLVTVDDTLPYFIDGAQLQGDNLDYVNEFNEDEQTWEFGDQNESAMFVPENEMQVGQQQLATSKR